MNLIKRTIFALLAVSALAACDRVPAGNVGVKVYLLGGDKGVDTEELGPGRYWIGINEELYVFPTFTQNYVWTKNRAESSPNDESISFQTTEGLTVNADVGISYAVDGAMVNTIFQKYRKGITEITDVYLRNMVRDALVTAASTKPIENVYGRGKADLIAEVEAIVREQVDPIGIKVERIYWVGELRLPDTVVSALNAKIEATQKAQQRENEIAQRKAEAQMEIEKARGVAESILIQAQADAEAIRIKGEALKQSPQVIQLNAVEKWDGVLPRFTGDAAVPFIDVGKE